MAQRKALTVSRTAQRARRTESSDSKDLQAFKKSWIICRRSLNRINLAEDSEKEEGGGWKSRC